MLAVRIIRGTAALPSDVEDQFFRAYGREMSRAERAFFGLTVMPAADSEEYEKLSNVA